MRIRVRCMLGVGLRAICLMVMLSVMCDGVGICAWVSVRVRLYVWDV